MSCPSGSGSSRTGEPGPSMDNISASICAVLRAWMPVCDLDNGDNMSKARSKFILSRCNNKYQMRWNKFQLLQDLSSVAMNRRSTMNSGRILKRFNKWGFRYQKRAFLFVPSVAIQIWSDLLSSHSLKPEAGRAFHFSFSDLRSRDKDMFCTASFFVRSFTTFLERV